MSKPANRPSPSSRAMPSIRPRWRGVKGQVGVSQDKLEHEAPPSKRTAPLLNGIQPRQQWRRLRFEIRQRRVLVPVVHMCALYGLWVRSSKVKGLSGAEALTFFLPALKDGASRKGFCVKAHPGTSAPCCRMGRFGSNHHLVDSRTCK